MIWDVPKIWKNETCWIVGGGNSITSQFNIPKKIVQQVHDGTLPISAFSPFMSMLHDKHVIGINGSFLLGDWIDVCFFGDRSFFFENIKTLPNYKGILVGCPAFLEVEGWKKFGVKYIKKSSIDYGISDNVSEVRWNRNSGSAAISLAHHFGCKRIILVGFDMTLSKTGKGHWHNLYNGKTDMPFAKHLVGFDQIAKDAQRLGIEIINANPDSAITQFPKMNVKDIEL